MNDKAKSMLSLCKRAGQLVSGESNCENAIKNHRARLILLSGEASKNTEKKFMNSSFYYKVPIIKLDMTKEELGKLIGEAQRSVISIIGDDFAKQITLLLNKSEHSGGGPIA